MIIKYINGSNICKLLDIDAQALYELRKKDDFPKGIKLSWKMVIYDKKKIRKWINGQSRI
jgi:predicted DNA-binding transcriptional regulator AlpA